MQPAPTPAVTENVVANPTPVTITSQDPSDAALTDGMNREPSSVNNAKGDLLKYKTLFDLNANKGKTYFSFMVEKVKPALDLVATKGFKVAPGSVVEAALPNVDDKVRFNAIRDGGGQGGLIDLANTLAKKDEASTVYTLPDQIAATSFRGNRYSTSTFLALVSGGGVAIKLNDRNFFYNVNYGTGKKDKDEMTGRSFGSAPGHKAADASDKFYLREVENFVRASGQDPKEFYRTLIQILTNSDASNLDKVSEAGQTVLTDFFTIYTAEQDRHLMANLKSHAWDVSLLEVTLLSALHAGQQKIMVMFNGKLTDTVPNQAPGGEPRTEMRPASMIDWWQFSSNPDPASKNRSGINVTKKDFRALGAAISNYERKNNPAVVAKVERNFKGKAGGNLFQKLTDYLISFKAPKAMDKAGYQLADDFSEFLQQVKKDAAQINNFTIAGGPAVTK